MSETASADATYLEFYERLRRLDRAGAVRLAEAYLDAGGTVSSLYNDVLMPAMIHAGSEWEADRISVAHEHYITEVTRDLIRRFGPRLWAAAEEGPAAVACCAPGERHVVGLMMVCDVLRASGLTVHALGEGAPAETVASFAAECGAGLLCVSCGLELHLPEVAELVAAARAAVPGLIVLAGGAAFGGNAARARALGADHFAADLRELHELLPALSEREAG